MPNTDCLIPAAMAEFPVLKVCLCFFGNALGCVEVLLHGSSSSSSSQRTLTLEEVDVGLAQDPRAQWLFISAEGGHALE